MDVRKLSLKQAISWYLMSSYLYYIKDQSVLTDYDYDVLCTRLLREWEGRKIHPHHHLLSKDALMAGTGYSIKKQDYPWGIKVAANDWLEGKYANTTESN